MLKSDDARGECLIVRPLPNFSKECEKYMHSKTTCPDPPRAKGLRQGLSQMQLQKTLE